jgi:hypothetical protein
MAVESLTKMIELRDWFQPGHPAARQFGRVHEKTSRTSTSRTPSRPSSSSETTPSGFPREFPEQRPQFERAQREHGCGGRRPWVAAPSQLFETPLQL